MGSPHFSNATLSIRGPRHGAGELSTADGSAIDIGFEKLPNEIENECVDNFKISQFVFCVHL